MQSVLFGSSSILPKRLDWSVTMHEPMNRSVTSSEQTENSEVQPVNGSSTDLEKLTLIVSILETVRQLLPLLSSLFKKKRRDEN
jgi:hypothetical protein